MKVAAKINAEHKGGNLHISVHGRFTPTTAAQLTLLMGKSPRLVGNIIIHTDDISRISPRSKHAFHKLVDLLKLPQNTMYFFGKNGPALCNNSKRIIQNVKRKATQPTAQEHNVDSLLCTNESFYDLDSLRECQVQLNRYQIT